MKRFWIEVDKFNRKLIPPALVVLLIVISIELFAEVENPATKLILEALDYLVLVIFVIDLIFLFIKAKTTSFFFKNYWLDILAVFPFGLMFSSFTRLYESVAAVERSLIAQEIIHETLGTEKLLEAGKLAEGEKLIEAEKVVAKEARLARYFKAFVRGLRAVTKSRLFTRYKKKHAEAHRRLAKTHH